MLYAVCISCTFLRAYSGNAQDSSAPDECPACGAELLVREGDGRFPSAYVSKVSLELLSTPTLSSGEERAGDRPTSA